MKLDRGNRVSTTFGDSIYYLGFLFTLIGLLNSLLSSTKDFDSAHFVVNFALALITTVIGVVARTLIASFVPDTQEIATRVELDLARAATRLQGSIESINARLLSVQEHFVGVLTGSAESLENELSSIMQKARRQTDEAIQQVAGSIQSWNSLLEGATSDLFETHQKSVNESGDALNKSLQVLTGTVSDVQKRLGEAELPPEIFSRQMGPALEELAAAFANLVGGMDLALGDALGNLEKSVGHITERLESAELPPEIFSRLMLPAIQHLRDGLANDLVTTQERVKGIFDQLEKTVTETQERIHRSELPTEIFAAQLKPALENIGLSLNATVTSISQDVNAALATLGGAVEQLQRKLTEVEMPSDVLVTKLQPALGRLETSMSDFSSATENIAATQMAAQSSMRSLLDGLRATQDRIREASSGLSSISGQDGALSQVQEHLLAAAVSMDRLSSLIDSRSRTFEYGSTPMLEGLSLSQGRVVRSQQDQGKGR